MIGKPIKVLVVEDSPVVQQLLTHVIDSDPRLRVVGVAENAAQAVRLIRLLGPDVVTMDIRLPQMNGFEATRWIMREHPLPIVVVASNVDDASLDISMNALRAGALSVVSKPAGVRMADYESMAAQLCTQLVIMSEVRVVRQRPTRHGAPPPVTHLPAAVKMVGLVASTGGPGAIARILGNLPPGFGAPVAVVQHMGAQFMGGFTHWLGTVYVAPGDSHLTVVEGVLVLRDGPPVQGLRPSGDVLFDSLAHHHGDTAVGVLLTGMGEDGARGLADLRQAGGHTIAEDRSTAVIWGMPGAAVAQGAAVEVLPVDAIALRLSQLVAARPGGGA